MLKKSDNQLLLKRIIDTIVIFLGLPIIIPLIFLVSCLVYVFLGRPIIFSQMRPGLNGKPFKLIKFRSMSNECNEVGDLLHDSKRLSPFGAFLRQTSMDELPEVWNILKGDMSLVGPRPLLMKYLDQYTEKQMERHNVRPGLTGLAQVNGRNLLEWEEKFELDCYYVENHSLKLDLKIILKTILVVFNSDDITDKDHATMPEFKNSVED